MMINNFDLFNREFEEGYFYFIQLIIRGKDHGIDEIGNSNRARCVKTYYIYSQDDLDRKKARMISLAEYYGARIYTHPAKRNDEKICLELIQYLVGRMADTQMTHLSKCYETVCGKHIPKQKVRVIDIDGVFMGDERIGNLILFIDQQRGSDDKVIQVLPTKNGCHVLTKPFDTAHLMEFNSNIPDITIQKNNPTILFIP